MNMITNLILLSAAVGAIAMTLTTSKVFYPLRKKIHEKVGGKISELIQCPYCTSHWLALIVVLLWQPIPMWSGISFIDWTLTMFVLVTGGSLFAGLIFHATKKIPQDQY